MLAVFILCLVGFGLSAGSHLLALGGALTRLPMPLAWVLLGSMFGCFFLAILVYPERQSNGAESHIGGGAAFRPLSPATRTAYVGLLVYAFFATLYHAPPGLMEGHSRSLLELVDAPYFFTAFVLVFSSAALLISHSALLIYKHEYVTG